jgi:Diaminopimelate decarboxylase
MTKRLHSNYHRFLDAFKNSYGKVRVFYSYKTNCVPGILKVLHKEGCGAEVASPYELWLAFKLGVEPSKVVYNGVIKSEENLKTAVQRGVGIINIDSVSEIYKLKEISDELKKEVDVGIRIPLARDSKSYFGLQPSEDKVIDTFRELKRNSLLNLCCLQVHGGTRVKNTEHYKKAIELSFSLIKELKKKLNTDIKYLDLGGGFGFPTLKVSLFVRSHCIKPLT